MLHIYIFLNFIVVRSNDFTSNNSLGLVISHKRGNWLQLFAFLAQYKLPFKKILLFIYKMYIILYTQCIYVILMTSVNISQDPPTEMSNIYVREWYTTMWVQNCERSNVLDVSCRMDGVLGRILFVFRRKVRSIQSVGKADRILPHWGYEAF